MSLIRADENGNCPEDTLACNDGKWTGGDNKFVTCIRNPLNANLIKAPADRYNYLMQNCPITELQIVKKGNTAEPCDPFIGNTSFLAGELCMNFNADIGIRMSKVPKNLPLSQFRVEEKLPCSKPTAVSSEADGDENRNQMYQINEYHNWLEGQQKIEY